MVASVSINGQLLLSENMAEVAGATDGIGEALGVFAAKAHEAGSMVMGRATYEMIMGNPEMKAGFAGIGIIVLSTRKEEADGVATASSPQEALEYLSGKGYGATVIAGGLKTYNSFLESGLVDEIFLSVIPVIINDGGILRNGSGMVSAYKPAGQKLLTPDIVQLHYAKK